MAEALIVPACCPPEPDLKRFYDIPIEQRMRRLAVESGREPAEIRALDGLHGLTPQQADKMVENAVGVFGLPLGIARNFIVNGRQVLIPMAIEEPSVVAGASFMAKLAAAEGGFTATAQSSEMIGQMQVVDLTDPDLALMELLHEKDALLRAAAEVDPILQNLGGGPRDLLVRQLEHPVIGRFLVLHLIYDVRDAMGANAVNTAVERLAPLVERITGGRVLLRILSNLADRRLARAQCTIRKDLLAFDDYAAGDVRDNIIAAWAFAAADPYRAATHNKGIMNGVDAVVIATGNDWRAVEAGAHAYAARDGRYTSLSTWRSDAAGNLIGELEMPMAVGIIGGATRVHPAAQAALNLMDIHSAAELAEVIVSVGLAQNLAALRALATEGIQRGHMSLHARQVAMAAGAIGDEVEWLAEKMVQAKTVRSDFAEQSLRELRSKNE